MLLVGGTFDETGGRASYIIGALGSALNSEGRHCDIVNGGDLEILQQLAKVNEDVLIWMPNVSNDEEKLLPTIKQNNPHTLLISSKRINNPTPYSDFDIISRLLKSRSNLGIVIDKNIQYEYRLMDPLGNEFVDTDSIEVLADAIRKRVDELQSMTRLRSTVVEDPEFVRPTVDEKFVNIVRDYGDKFSEFVNAVNPERLLGNASFRSTRCCHGFTGERVDDVYMVSRRNVDKQTMTGDDFVPVLNNEQVVEYIDINKPSVDSPIQVRIFNWFENVNYIIHGHCYVKGAPITDSVLPCGAVEEFQEIAKLADRRSANFAINLKGHGCIILANNLDYFDRIELEPRPFPEVI